MHSAAGAAPRDRNAEMLADVRAGLTREPKELSPKYFYDTRGSELFEEITQLPEYYLSRTERALLERWIPEWIAGFRPQSLVELGAGSAVKTRIILDAMHAAGHAGRYVPIDISAKFLDTVTTQLREDYPTLEVVPTVADISAAIDLPQYMPHPVLYSFLGSTIGNFDPMDATRLLLRVRRAMTDGDRFLMGVDLRKDVGTIEAAYNDAQGVTAEFNRNILRVLNRELGADFRVNAWQHRAFYNAEWHCIEMHLVSVRAQAATIPGIGTIAFRAGESIRTEISCKHDRDSVAGMFSSAGLQIDRWETDPGGLFALVLGSPQH